MAIWVHAFQTARSIYWTVLFVVMLASTKISIKKFQKKWLKVCTFMISILQFKMLRKMELYKKIKLRFLDASFDASLVMMLVLIWNYKIILIKWKRQRVGHYYRLFDLFLCVIPKRYKRLTSYIFLVIPTKAIFWVYLLNFTIQLVGLIQRVKLKLLFHKACLTNVDWDYKITGQLKENWQFIVKFVGRWATICIKRSEAGLGDGAGDARPLFFAITCFFLFFLQSLWRTTNCVVH